MYNICIHLRNSQYFTGNRSVNIFYAHNWGVGVESNFRPIRNALRTIGSAILGKANDGDRAKSPVLPNEQ